MPSLPNIDINDFDYLLPEEKIAKYPLEQRDLSKLLVYKNQSINDSLFRKLPDLLPENALLLFNNTKVFHARLNFRKETGAHIEIFCLEPYEPADYYLIFEQTKSCSWKCMIGNKRKWKSGKLSREIAIGQQIITLSAELIHIESQTFNVKFTWSNNVTFSEILDATGNIPIPPYLNRESEAIDALRYQTVFSKIKGSVAAPTAGLHFTPNLLDTLAQAGILTEEITLHVGAGTFQPVKSRRVQEHSMHTETFTVHIDTLKTLMDKPSIIPVGTTSLRTIESVYYLAKQIISGDASLEQPLQIGQWEPYEDNSNPPANELLQQLITYMQNKGLKELQAATQIIIVPGYRFKFAKGLITNFHLPKSTLLLLIAAMVGDSWKDIYHYALEHDFRFLSYGDSSLLLTQ